MGRKKQKERETPASTEEGRTLDNGYYGSLECQAIFQALYMGHFLTALATGPATDTQRSHSLVITNTHILLSQW